MPHLRTSAFVGLFLFMLSLGSVESVAHAHGVIAKANTAGEVSPTDDLMLTMERLRTIAEGVPLVIDVPGASVATQTVGGHTLTRNGAFDEMVRAWIRSYHEEYKTDCPDCVDFDPEQLTDEVEPQIAQSFVHRKVLSPIGEGIEHVSLGAGKLGGELGAAAFTQKVAGEAAETGFSVFWMKVVGPMHFFCHAIDAWIILATRYIQGATRVFTMSAGFNNSPLDGARDLIKHGWFTAMARRAEKKATFALGPYAVNERELEQLNLQGAKRFWGRVDSNNRQQFLARLFKRADQSQSFTLNSKDAIKKRFKRFAFLVTRSSFVGGRTPMDRALQSRRLWVIGLQENLLERAVTPRSETSAEDMAAPGLAARGATLPDEVRAGIAAEFAGQDPERAKFFEGLLRDVDVVFDAKVPSAVRFFHARFIEAALVGFVYDRSSEVVEAKSDLFHRRNDNFLQTTGNVFRQFRMLWRYGKTARFAYELSDFLRLAAVQTSGKKLMNSKYETMESMMRLWRALAENSKVTEVKNRDQISVYDQGLRDRYLDLLTFRPWREKRSVSSWIPFLTPIPECRELHMAGH